MSSLTPGAVASHGMAPPGAIILDPVASAESVSNVAITGGASATYLTYSSGGDTNGLMHHLGTAEATQTWTNPAQTRCVDCRSLSVDSTNYAYRAFDQTAGNRFITPDSSGQWIVVGFHGKMTVTGYTIQNSFDSQNSPRSWVIEGSNDYSSWTTIDTRTSDTTLDTNSEWGYWDSNGDSDSAFSWLRMRQTGTNSNSNNRLVIAGLEFYGIFYPEEEYTPTPTGYTEYKFREGGVAPTTGIFYDIGTDYGESSWSNPSDGSRVTASASSNSANAGRTTDQVADTSTGRYISTDTANSWVKWDFGASADVVVRGWMYYPSTDANHMFEIGKLQGSNNDTDWTDISTIDISAESSQWGVDDNYFLVDDTTDTTAYRYIRLLQTGLNSTGADYLAVCEVELYGLLTTPIASITPTSISSDESVSSPQINQTIYPNSIDSAESVNNLASVTKENPFPQSGILYDLGEQGVNPFISPILCTNLGWDVSSAFASDNALDKAMDRDITTQNSTSYFRTTDTASSWLMLDFGVDVQVDTYRLMSSNAGYTPRNWKLQGSANASVWTDIDIRTSDTTLVGALDSEEFTPSETGNIGYYRYYRILQTGVNADGDNVLALEMMDFYGTHPGFSGITSSELPHNAVEKVDELTSDTGGILYEVGTTYGNTSWSNPAPSTVVTSQSSTYLGRTLSNASDRSEATSWTSSTGATHWGKWDFGVGTKVNIKGIALHSHPTLNDVLENFVVEGSNDDSGWTTLITVGTHDRTYVDNVYYWADDVTDTSTWRYIRYTVSSVSDRARINEAELYGFVGVPTVTPTSITSEESISSMKIFAGAVPDSITSEESVSNVQVNLTIYPDSITSEESVSDLEYIATSFGSGFIEPANNDDGAQQTSTGTPVYSNDADGITASTTVGNEDYIVARAQLPAYVEYVTDFKYRTYKYGPGDGNLYSFVVVEPGPAAAYTTTSGHLTTRYDDAVTGGAYEFAWDAPSWPRYFERSTPTLHSDVNEVLLDPSYVPGTSYIGIVLKGSNDTDAETAIYMADNGAGFKPGFLYDYEPAPDVLTSSIDSEESVSSPQINQTIYPDSITSTESVSSPVVISTQIVSPDSITSEESVSSPVFITDQTVSPNSITSEESVSSPQLNLTIYADSITSDESVSDAAVNLTIYPDSIASDESISNPTLNLTIYPDSVASAESVSEPTVAGSTIFPSSIASAEVVSDVTVTTGAVTVSPTSIASEESVEDVTVSAASTTVSPTSIASEEAVSDVTVNQVIYADSIASEETFDNVTVSTGAVTISPDSIDSAEVVSDVVATTGFIITPTSIDSVEAFDNPTLTPGVVTVDVDSILSAEAVSDATIQVGALTISPTSISSAEVVNDVSVQVGAVIVDVDSVVSSESVNDVNVTAVVTINVDSVDSGEQVPNPTAVYDTVVDVLSVDSAEVVPGPTIVMIVNVDGIVSEEIVSNIVGIDFSNNPTTVLGEIVAVTTDIVSTTVKRATVQEVVLSAERID